MIGELFSGPERKPIGYFLNLPSKKLLRVDLAGGKECNR
jgi:hypothetical protein